MTVIELGHEQQEGHPDRQLVAGRYRLHSRIGHGRLGEIYEADDEGYRDLGVGQRVAIQLLPDRIADNNGLFSKLKFGYTVIRSASHPNIVSYFDVDHDGDFGYLIMARLDGASLRTILNDATMLPLDEASPVIRAVGDALQFLHAKSIVHGELTAENVFITEDLEVRLLDIVPLDSASSILRGVASGDPFSRSEIEDDVYGLACLAYEMLAGKHPFNFHSWADARHAGIEPPRIGSLPEKQWNALCRALSFDHERRTPAVADFLHEFGITGTERLQPSRDATTERASSSKFMEKDAQPAAHSTDRSPGVHASDHMTSDNRVDPPIGRIARPKSAREKRKRAKWIPSPILVLVLLGLGTWFVYGQPRDDIVTLTDYVDSYLDGRFTGGRDDSLSINAGDIAPTVSQDAESAIVPPSTPTQIVAEDAADATDAAETLPADEPLADSETDASQSESEFAVIQSFVTISERDGAARITARRPENAADRVFWWTGDHTAIADRDYIPIELPVEGFTSGEEAETIHIPLIDDGLPEPRETFYVYLGRHNAQLGRLEPILRVRVEISDDE